jgi:hypothetical protein
VVSNHRIRGSALAGHTLAWCWCCWLTFLTLVLVLVLVLPRCWCWLVSREAFLFLQTRFDIDVIILAGRGKSFSAGAEVATGGFAPSDPNATGPSSQRERRVSSTTFNAYIILTQCLH